MLNLSGAGIGSTGMKRLAQSCCRNHPAYQTPLVCLWLENNDLPRHAAADVVSLIQRSPSLRRLFLAYNELENQGCQMVIEACFRQVEVCSLACNGIGPTGARAVAEALKDPRCNLRTLILDGNHLGDEGAMAIVDALKVNTSLKTLELRYNGMTQKGLMVFRDAMANGEILTLHTLRLEEEADEECLPHGPRRFVRPRNPQTRREREPQRPVCHCHRCQVLSEIDFFLALNRTGRVAYDDTELLTALWPRILAKSASKYFHPAVLHKTLTERPDVAMIS